MNLFFKILKLKEITFLLAALIVAFQIFPWQGTQANFPGKQVDSSINKHVFILNVNTGLNFPNNSKQNFESKSAAQYLYDKNDLTPISDIAYYKKIYLGQLSSLQRYRNFLIAQFSTST
jgi:hypothetical protein